MKVREASGSILVWIRSGRHLAIAGLVAGLAVAAAWTVRVAWADYYFQQLTVPATERAIALTPGQASYLVRLALLLADDDPARSKKAFERVVTLNPLDGNAWIELGLRAEIQGDLNTAERCLLRAAEVDQGYAPRWSLANYYFRRRDERNFWQWSRRAAAIVYGDPAPLFRLAWNFTDETDRIAERLGINRPALQAGYLSYLLDQNRIANATAAARRLLTWKREEDTALLLRTCDRMLEEKRPEEATTIWNALAEAHRVPGGLLAPEDNVSLTNGRFTTAPSSQGFDWSLPAIEGVNAARMEDPTGIRFSFSGRQAASLVLLKQYVPVVGSRRYDLVFHYRAAGMGQASGLHWRVVDANTSLTLAQSGSLSSEEQATGALSFTTGARCRLIRLVFGYDREFGTTSIEGNLTLQIVKLVLASR